MSAPDDFENYEPAPNYEEGPAPTTQIARLAPSRLPIAGSIAKEFDVTPDQWRVLVDQIFPAAKSIEAIGMALAYCRARNLDIYKRPVHIVPMYSTALKRMVETVWPGIAEIRTTAHRTCNYAGIDPIKLGPMVEETFTDEVEKWEGRRKVGTETIEATVRYPEFAEATVYRLVEGKRYAFTATVYWEEAYASQGRTTVPNTMWQRRARGQLMKCVEAAALRMAFPEELGNVYAAEEMEGRTIDGHATETAAAPAAAPAVTRLAPPPPDPAPAVEDDAAVVATAEKAKQPPATTAEPLPPVDEEQAPYEAGEGTAATEETAVVTPTPDAGSEEWFGNLIFWAEQAQDADALEEVWNDLDVESELSKNPEAMARADFIKAQQVQRIERRQLAEAGQTDMLEGMPEATKQAVRNARTP